MFMGGIKYSYFTYSVGCFVKTAVGTLLPFHLNTLNHAKIVVPQLTYIEGVMLEICLVHFLAENTDFLHAFHSCHRKSTKPYW